MPVLARVRPAALAVALAWAWPAAAQTYAPGQAAPTEVRWSARVMPGFELKRTHPSEVQIPSRDRDRTGVFLNQARLEVELERGMVEAELSVELADALRPETSAAQDSPQYLRDAWLGVRFEKELRLRAGHFKRPFSALELTSNGDLPMRGRGLTNSLIVEEARFGDRALGLMLWGKLPGRVDYYLALSNPDWTTDADLETPGGTSSARVEWELVDGLTLGADYGLQLVFPRIGRDDQAHAAGLDARLAAGPLTVLFDARVGQVNANSNSAEPLGYGLVLYGSYDVALGQGVALQPTLLGEYVDADTDFSRDEAVRAVAGLNVIVADGLRVMPQAELVRSLRAAAADSPWTNSETYYVMLSAQL